MSENEVVSECVTEGVGSGDTTYAASLRGMLKSQPLGRGILFGPMAPCGVPSHSWLLTL